MKERFELFNADCLKKLKDLPNESVDLVLSDFPYGISFMGKDWDSVKEDFYFKVAEQLMPKMKAGSFLVTTFTPRQDMLWRLLRDLEKAGFELKHSGLFWLYHTGFPKASDISKGIDKRNGLLLGKDFCNLIKNKRIEKGYSTIELAEKGSFYGKINHGGSVSNWEEGKGTPTLEQYNKLIEILQLNDFKKLNPVEREIVSKQSMTFGIGSSSERLGKEKIVDLPATEESKKWSGFKSFSLKPSVECVVVAQKKKSEKTIVGQVLDNGCGAVNIENCRIPYANENDFRDGLRTNLERKWGFGDSENDYSNNSTETKPYLPQNASRFPANLCVEDDCLVGEEQKSGWRDCDNKSESGLFPRIGEKRTGFHYGDFGSVNRFYSLDAWALKRNITLTEDSAFFDVAKPSKAEKNLGLEGMEEKNPDYCVERMGQNNFVVRPDGSERKPNLKQNFHPTCKPVKLFCYLSELFCQPSGVVLDPFMGSGTTGVACAKMNKKFIGIELNKEYFEIAERRIIEANKQNKLGKWM